MIILGYAQVYHWFHLAFSSTFGWFRHKAASLLCKCRSSYWLG